MKSRQLNVFFHWLLLWPVGKMIRWENIDGPGSKHKLIYFSYSDVKLWLSFRIYADSTFNSTYEEYKQPKHIQKRICRNLRNYIKTHHGPLLPSEVAQLFLSCQNENRNGLKSCRP